MRREVIVVVWAAAVGLYAAREVGNAQIAVYVTFAGLVGGMLVIGLSLGGRSTRAFALASRVPVYAPATLSTVGIVVANINIVAADVYFKQGSLWDRAGQFDKSVGQYQQALRLAGNQDRYYLLLGRAYLELAKASHASSREQLLEAGRQALEQARDLNPLNTGHYVNLARLYVVWGSVADQSKLGVANEYYRQTTLVSPGEPICTTNGLTWT